MKKKIFGKKEKEIIRLIGLGVLATASIAMPGLAVALKPFLDDNQKKQNFKRSIENLRSKKVIYLSGDAVVLSKTGQKLFKKFLDDNIKITKPKKWDKVWRVVAYDIPDKHKKEREYFRKKLLELGFIKIQESLMLIPYECKKEIAIIAQNLRISPYIIYLKTKHIPRQIEMERRFKID